MTIISKVSFEKEKKKEEKTSSQLTSACHGEVHYAVQRE